MLAADTAIIGTQPLAPEAQQRRVMTAGRFRSMPHETREDAAVALAARRK
jgi:hypothetical protein